RTSRQAERLSSFQRVLWKYSYQFWRVITSPSTFIVGSETRFHLAPLYAQSDSIYRYLRARKSYFLQHGVLGLKRVGMFNPDSANFPDYVIASSSWEKEILVDSAVEEARIDITGLARWDL